MNRVLESIKIKATAQSEEEDEASSQVHRLLVPPGIKIG